MTNLQTAQLGFCQLTAMDILLQELIANGKYTWAAATAGFGDGVGPGIPQNGCKDWMASRCTSAWQQKVYTQQVDLNNPMQSVASFLITRSPYAWIGSGWKSGGVDWTDAFLLDVGVPLGLCSQISSGVFHRTWTYGDVILDCNTWTATIPTAPRSSSSSSTSSSSISSPSSTSSSSPLPAGLVHWIPLDGSYVDLVTCNPSYIHVLGTPDSCITWPSVYPAPIAFTQSCATSTFPTLQLTSPVESTSTSICVWINIVNWISSNTFLLSCVGSNVGIDCINLWYFAAGITVSFSFDYNLIGAAQPHYYLPPGQWFHLCVVYSALTSFVTIYVNATQIYSGFNSHDAGPTWGTPVLGGQGGSSDYQGSIAVGSYLHWQVYNIPISATQVTQTFTSTTPGNPVPNLCPVSSSSSSSIASTSSFIYTGPLIQANVVQTFSSPVVGNGNFQGNPAQTNSQPWIWSTINGGSGQALISDYRSPFGSGDAPPTGVQFLVMAMYNNIFQGIEATAWMEGLIMNTYYTFSFYWSTRAGHGGVYDANDVQLNVIYAGKSIYQNAIGAFTNSGGSWIHVISLPFLPSAPSGYLQLQATLHKNVEEQDFLITDVLVSYPASSSSSSSSYSSSSVSSIPLVSSSPYSGPFISPNVIYIFDSPPVFGMSNNVQFNPPQTTLQPFTWSLIGNSPGGGTGGGIGDYRSVFSPNSALPPPIGIQYLLFVQQGPITTGVQASAYIQGLSLTTLYTVSFYWGQRYGYRGGELSLSILLGPTNQLIYKSTGGQFYDSLGGWILVRSAPFLPLVTDGFVQLQVTIGISGNEEDLCIADFSISSVQSSSSSTGG
jgi:hypothetical protein